MYRFCRSPLVFNPAPDDIGYKDFGPWLLAQVCRAALDNHELGDGGLVDYARLPHFVTTEPAAHFGTAFSATELAQMETAARYDAKAPINRFEADVARKQAAATPRLRELAERWLGEVWHDCGK